MSRHEQDPCTPADRDDPGWGAVPPGDRLAHLGHIEHPMELYTHMTPVSNTMPAPADADEWIAAFGRVVADGNLPGGDGRTGTAMIMDTDPQGTAATPLGGPTPSQT
ncbi:hypothetical protein ACGFR8_31450 [Streptomyces brevispora]|uniref:hypothetical protein n=1 Tax=Streptomyces brevispora TaxID=887462 RepID=UPI003711D4F1